MDNIEVARFLGTSVGLGQIVMVVTQVVKMADRIPVISSIPGAQAIINRVRYGNAMQNRVFAAIVAVILNAFWMYHQTGTFASTGALMSTLATYMSALGGYDLFMSGDKKDDPNA